MTKKKIDAFQEEFKNLCQRYGYDHAFCAGSIKKELVCTEAIVTNRDSFICTLIGSIAEYSKQLGIATVEYGNPETEN